MKIHEYQAKQILARYGVRIPRGELAESPAAARAIAERLGSRVVLKAQIHAGGRGKGGGIKLAGSPDEAEGLARQMIGMTLVTPQTGPEGRIVQRLLVEEALEIQQELYLGLVIDRAAEAAVVMASTEGGMEIEKVAAEHPELIFKEWIDPAAGLAGFQARKLAFKLGLSGETFKQAVKFLLSLYKAFQSSDASLAEINPLVVTGKGELLAVDGKMVLDDNGLFRHADLAQMRDVDEETSAEREAREGGLSYVQLDGQIGCMVNGAGLAMATMDIIKHFGGSPANFLDIGGGARAERVATALRLILADPNVKAVLFNIFGGITRCDEVARGILVAFEEVRPAVPLVARLVGTNEVEGRAILEAAGYRLITATTLAEAAQKAVAAASGELAA